MQRLAKVVLLVTLAAASWGWVRLVSVAWGFARLPGRGATQRERGWPARWERIEKVLLLPDGQSAFLVPTRGEGAAVCHLELTSGRVSYCTEVPYAHPGGGLSHAYGSSTLLVVSWRGPGGTAMASLFTAAGRQREVELRDVGRITNAAFDGAKRRFSVSYVVEGKSHWHTRFGLAHIPLDGGEPELEKDEYVNTALHKFEGDELIASFPTGTLVFGRWRAPGRCVAGAGRGERRCVEGEQTIFVGSTMGSTALRPNAGDLWVDARGVETPLGKAAEGFERRPGGPCDLAIHVRDDGSEEPELACPTADNVMEVKRGSELVRFRTLRAGGESVLVAERADGTEVRLARDANEAPHVGYFMGQRAVLLSTPFLMPLTDDLRPRKPEPPRVRLGQILDRRFELARAETAAFLGALLVLPLLAWGAIRLLRSAAPSRWIWLLSLALALHGAFAAVALGRFAEFLIVP